MAPFYYETWWFYTSSAAALVLMAVALQGYRLRVQRRILALEHDAALARERERIARDMHDDVGASLTKIKLLSEIAGRELSQPAELRSHIQRISETSAQVAREMDEIVWAVNPRNDTLDKLADYISRSAEEYLRLCGIRCRLAISTDLPNLPLNAELRHGVFLIVKEALHNIAKHSHATEVRVQLSLDAVRLTISVEDNGCGFDPVAATKNSRCSGLANMPRRTRALGGQLQILSAPGQGTHLILTVPLPD